MAALSRNGLTRTGDVLGWDWGHKIGNTIQFRLYLKLLKVTAVSTNVFRGFHPIEAIELNFLGEV